MTPVVLTIPEALQAWPHVAPRLAELAATHDAQRIGADDVLAMVESGERQMWVVTDGRVMKAAFFTEIVNYPRGRWCEISMLVGEDLSGWVARIADVEAWARQLGCVGTRLIGRRGWGRALAAHDYREAGTILEKAIVGQERAA